MACFTESKLRSYSRNRRLKKEARDNVKGFKSLAEATIFLSHSHSDKELVEGLINWLSSRGVEVYVDWEDDRMPEKTNAETADRIKKQITKNNIFMMLATRNACNSRWVPWEVGIADEKKQRDQILVVPVEDDSGKFHGNEYLQLYRSLRPQSSSFTKFGVYEPGKSRRKMMTEEYLRRYGG